MEERRIRQVFRVSVVLKGLHALLECASGVAIGLIGTDTVSRLVNALTQEELVEDPKDFLALHLLSWAQGFSVETKHFYAFYLVSHGLVKLFLVVGLLRNKLWAYPVSLVVLGLFIVYQLYRFSYTHGWGLIALSIFDVAVMWLIWHEYRVIRRAGRVHA
jgi:uncharacterized membrane protein